MLEAPEGMSIKDLYGSVISVTTCSELLPYFIILRNKTLHPLSTELEEYGINFIVELLKRKEICSKVETYDLLKNLIIL